MSGRQPAIPERVRTCQHMRGKAMRESLLREKMSRLRKGAPGGSLASKRCQGRGAQRTEGAVVDQSHSVEMPVIGD